MLGQDGRFDTVLDTINLPSCYKASLLQLCLVFCKCIADRPLATGIERDQQICRLTVNLTTLHPLYSDSSQIYEPMAVDNFFEASHGKRKRGGVNGGSNGGQRRVNGSSSSSSNSHSHVHKGKGRAQQQQRQREDGPPSRPRRVHDEEIEESDSENDNDNDDDIDVDGAAAGEEEFESDQEADRRETPAQKRLRLAQQYLDTLKAAQEGKSCLCEIACCSLCCFQK